MLFTHDVEHSLACLVDLVNSEGPTDGLAELSDLQDFVHRYRFSDVGTLGPSDVEDVRRLRDLVRPAFGARSEADAAAAVNRLVAAAPVAPRLTDHDDYAWHLHYFTPGATVAEHLAVDGGMALAQVVAAGEWQRLRTCEAPDCDQVLVDLSRNRSRRYCDAQSCGNRIHVAAYRQRRREDS